MAFKRLNWGRKELIMSSKLNDMVQNDDWLFQNMIRGYYNVYGVARDSGLEIRAGYVKGYMTEDTSFFVEHYFPRPFVPGSRPVVVNGVASGSAQRFIVGIKGLDNRGIPDHRGFLAHFSQFRDPGGPTKFDSSDQWLGYLAISANG